MDDYKEELRSYKRERFHAVLEWERKQSEDSKKYRKIVHVLIRRIIKKGCNSREANRAITRFLYEKAKGYQMYSEALINELVYLPDPIEDPNTELLSDPEVIFKDQHLKTNSLRIGLAYVSEYQTNIARCFKESSNNIQKIIKTHLENILFEYESRVLEAEKKIEMFARQSEDLISKSDKLLKKFIEAMQVSEENQFHTTCIWLAEMRFLAASSLASEFQKNIGRYLQVLWQDTMMMECMRISGVKKVMKAFVEMQSWLFKVDGSGVVDCLEKVEEKDIENFKDVKLFKEEELEDLRGLGIENDYIVKIADWMPKMIKEYQWVIKEGEVFMESGLFKQWKECYAILVKSRFLHIFLVKPKVPFVDPIISLYLAGARLMVSQSSDYYVEITENYTKKLYNKLVLNKQVVIRTKDPDVLDEWMELIQSLK